MSDSPNLICEKHNIGARTRERLVGKHQCATLFQHHIDCVGLTDASDEYHFARLRPATEQMLLCHGGEAEVWVAGRWVSCRAGMAYLTPALVSHAYRVPQGHHWRVCWVSYNHLPGEPPVLKVTAPAVIQTDPRALTNCILGLWREMQMDPPGAVRVQAWTDLIHSYVLHALRQEQPDDLWQLWEAVNADLAHPWSIEKLIRLAGLSREELRRRCLRRTGRSPMQHVTRLRMRHACSLLLLSEQKLLAVASAVGYDNAFAFSVAFKRHIGVAPAGYRKARMRPQM